MRLNAIPRFDPSAVQENAMTWSYWSGPKPYPLMDLCLQSIARHHSNFMLLNDDDVRELGWGDALALTEGVCKQHRADLIRLLILDRFGGQWLDSDTLCYAEVDGLTTLANPKFNMSIPRLHGRKKVFAVPLVLRANSEESRWAVQRCTDLIRAKLIGEGRNWVETANGLYREMIEGRMRVQVRHHWKYQLVANRNTELMMSTNPRYIHRAVGGATLCSHLGANKHGLTQDTYSQLLSSRRVISQMIRKAFGLPTGIWGRICESCLRLPADRKVRFAEIGVLRGRNSIQILQSRPNAEGLLVDPWAEPSAQWLDSGDGIAGKFRQQQQWDQLYGQAMNAISQAGVRKRATVMRMTSLEAAKQVPDQSLDLVFIDGDHSYEGCSEDIQAWFPKVKHGGWIGGHDYDNDQRNRDGSLRWPKWGVKRAVDEFCGQWDFPLDLGVDFTWFVRVPE